MVKLTVESNVGTFYLWYNDLYFVVPIDIIRTRNNNGPSEPLVVQHGVVVAICFNKNNNNYKYIYKYLFVRRVV